MTEKPLKKTEQIRLDEELAFKLQAEEDEQARLAREKAEKIEEVNISWDNVQAMIEADRLLAERLQAREQEELTDEEKARLFVELLEKRHFAALRAQEKRNKPPTKAQKKRTMSTYLKHMAGYKQKSLKKAKAEMAQESSSKRAGEELEQENGRNTTYEIMRADRRDLKTYLLFSQLLKEFDREDLENLWKRLNMENLQGKESTALEDIMIHVEYNFVGLKLCSAAVQKLSNVGVNVTTA
ncbi:hypothetical protein Tco_0798360 [Tanacetum coccineum]